MDTSKYMVPKLPTSQNILEDICGFESRQANEELKTIRFEGLIDDTYRCYVNFNTLKRDLEHQNELNNKLEDLNKQLMQCIENMKKQQ